MAADLVEIKTDDLRQMSHKELQEFAQEIVLIPGHGAEDRDELLVRILRSHL
jgi:hypothetical protein